MADDNVPNDQASLQEVPTEKSLQPEKIPIIQEQVKVGKKTVQTGKMRIKKKVSEHEELVNTTLQQDEIDVERVPVNKVLDTPPPVRYEGDTMIIPVLKEVAVIQKKFMLVEEIHVKKRKVQTEAHQIVVLRKEEIDIERSSSGD